MVKAQISSDLTLTDAEALMRGDIERAGVIVKAGWVVLLERVPHPWEPESGADWYVLVDTMIGQSVGAWQTDPRATLIAREKTTLTI